MVVVMLITTLELNKNLAINIYSWKDFALNKLLKLFKLNDTDKRYDT